MDNPQTQEEQSWSVSLSIIKINFLIEATKIARKNTPEYRVGTQHPDGSISYHHNGHPLDDVIDMYMAFKQMLYSRYGRAMHNQELELDSIPVLEGNPIDESSINADGE